MEDSTTANTDLCRQPKVSVVVCTYNQEDTIAVALDSILAQQTDFEFEIIVADDCSTDSTPDICARYARRHPDKIRFIHNARNKGVTLNYFDAICMARGPYIADLAGDDIWPDSRKLAVQARTMDSDPEITLCHGAWRMFDDNGNVWQSDRHAMPAGKTVHDGKELLPALINHRNGEWFVHLCTAMYRRDTVMELMKIYPELFDGEWPCEDFQLICMLASRGKIAWIPDILLYYRVGNTSVSSTEDAAKNSRFACRVTLLTLAVARNLGFQMKEVEKFCRFNLQYAAMQSVIAGDADSHRFMKSTIHKAFPLKPSAKTRLVMAMTSSRWMRTAARKLHRLKTQVYRSY